MARILKEINALYRCDVTSHCLILFYISYTSVDSFQCTQICSMKRSLERF